MDCVHILMHTQHIGAKNCPNSVFGNGNIRKKIAFMKNIHPQNCFDINIQEGLQQISCSYSVPNLNNLFREYRKYLSHSEIQPLLKEYKRLKITPSKLQRRKKIIIKSYQLCLKQLKIIEDHVVLTQQSARELHQELS